MLVNLEDSMRPQLQPDICGWEVGGSYTLDKNIVGSLAYSSYDALEHKVGNRYRMLFARVACFF